VGRRHSQQICGLAVVDLRTGAVEGALEFSSDFLEIDDVAALPGVRRPLILNLTLESVPQAFSTPGSARWLRPEQVEGPGPEGATPP
jgi:hypothetical protein